MTAYEILDYVFFLYLAISEDLAKLLSFFKKWKFNQELITYYLDVIRSSWKCSTMCAVW